MAHKLLTVSEVAEEFQVTSQTIRNWIDSRVLPAAKIGRAFRVKREDVDAMLALAEGNSASLATRRDLWAPEKLGLPHRRSEREPSASVSAIDPSAMPLSKGE
jgi:excisionase family DNA binding protein